MSNAQTPGSFDPPGTALAGLDADLWTHLRHGALLMAPEGVVVQANPAALRLLGLGLEEMNDPARPGPGRGLIRTDGTPCPWTDHPAAIALATGLPVEGMVLGLPGREGRDLRWFQVSAAPLCRPGAAAPDQVLLSLADVTQARCEAEALAASEARYRDLLACQGEGFAVVDGQERFLIVNPKAEAIFGVAPGTLPGRSLLDFLPADQADRVLGESTLRRHGTASTYELKISRPDGTSRLLVVTATPWTTPSGDLQVIGVFRDTTEQKAVEEQLKESEAKYKYLLENLNEIVMMVDHEDRILFVNRRFTELLGYLPEEVLGRVGHTFLIDPAHHEVIRRANRERKDLVYSQYELEFRSKDGLRIPFLVSGSPLFDAEGRVIGSIGALTNIQDRKQSEREREEVKEHFETIFRANPDPLLIMRLADRTILNINNAFTAVSGYVREDVIGNDHFEASVYANPEDRHRLVARIKAEGQCDNFEANFRTKGGGTFLGSVTARVIRIIGQPHLIILIRDVTELKRLERQLMQAQKLEGLGTLAGGIAHDFNNVLAMILGAAELMAGPAGDHPVLTRQVARIREAAERGASISRQLLVFSRPDPGEFKPISLGRTLTELIGMLEHFLPKTIQIESRHPLDQGLIIGDSGQIYQALMNLALNAADAMPAGGRLSLRVFTADPDRMKRRFALPDRAPFLGIEVADTGAGMDEGMVEKIFEPFFSTKEKGKGTGLGLAIVHGIVKGHGGFIEVQSQPGQGTAITLYFPATEAIGSGPEPTAEAKAQVRAGTILLVEDEAMLRELLQECLAEAGYTVLLATNGLEALELFQARRGMIDLVITDLGMPAMGGEELFRRLRLLDPTVKVIVSSGYLDGLTREHLLAMGVCKVMQKPYRLKTFQAEIGTVI